MRHSTHLDMEKQTGFLLLIPLLFSIACSNQAKHIEKSAFQKYLDRIPEFSLPSEFSSKTEHRVISFDSISQSDLDAYNPLQIPLLGKITVNEKVSSIVYFYPADWSIPIFVTYKNNGEKIDSLRIYAGYKDEEENYFENSRVSVSQDYFIQVVDTSISYQTDNMGLRIESTANMKVTSKLYQISTEGKFELK